jgi:hypothetical protein
MRELTLDALIWTTALNLARNSLNLARNSLNLARNSLR